MPAYDILNRMEISQPEKHDVINTVKIEMERMFGVLDVYFLPDMEGHHHLVRTIEASFRDDIDNIDRSPA